MGQTNRDLQTIFRQKNRPYLQRSKEFEEC